MTPGVRLEEPANKCRIVLSVDAGMSHQPDGSSEYSINVQYTIPAESPRSNHRFETLNLGESEMPALTSSSLSNTSSLPRTPTSSSFSSVIYTKDFPSPANQQPRAVGSSNLSPANTRLLPSASPILSSSSAPNPIMNSPGSPARRPQGGESTTVDHAIKMAGGDLLKAIRALVDERNSLVSRQERDSTYLIICLPSIVAINRPSRMLSCGKW